MKNNPSIEGAFVETHAYGPAVVRRLYLHRDTNELVADVKAATGELLHLSIRYVNTLKPARSFIPAADAAK